MFKILTLTAFLTTQLSLPYAQAQEATSGSAQPVVSEFERSAQKMEEKVAAQKAAAEKKAQKQALKNEIRKDILVLTARTNELETLAENVPNVREEVVEDSARALRLSEDDYKNRRTIQGSAVVAVASGLVYALTKFDLPRAIAQGKAETAAGTKVAQSNVRVASNPVNNALRYLHKNQTVERASLGVGALAIAVMGIAYFDSKPLSNHELATVRALETQYLSAVVSGGDTQYLNGDQIRDALDDYEKNPELRAAVVNEVKTIVAETERLAGEVNAKKAQLDAL